MFTGGSQMNLFFFILPIKEVKRELRVLFNHKGHLANPLEEAIPTSAKNKVRSLLYIALHDQLPTHGANVPLPVEKMNKAPSRV